MKKRKYQLTLKGYLVHNLFFLKVKKFQDNFDSNTYLFISNEINIEFVGNYLLKKFLYAFSNFDFSSGYHDFPVLTICRDFDFAYKQDVVTKAFEKVKNPNKERDPKPEKEELDTFLEDVRNYNFPQSEKGNEYDFFEKSTYDLEEILKNIKFETMKLSSTINEFVCDPEDCFYGKEIGEKNRIRLEKNHKLWNQVNNKNFGRCYSFQVPKDVSRLEVNFHQFVRHQ